MDQLPELCLMPNQICFQKFRAEMQMPVFQKDREYDMILVILRAMYQTLNHQ